MQSIQKQLDGYRKKNRRLKKWKKAVTALASVVIFCTVYALILPAITLEGNTFCGKKEHKHSEECYKQDVLNVEEKLVCEKEEVKPHTHGDECYEIQTIEVPVEETIEIPVEEEDISEENTELAEDSENDVDTDIIETSKTETVVVTNIEIKEEKVLICEREETKGHTHGTECYEEIEILGEKVLDCDKEEHEHTKVCYSNPNADVETETEWKKTFGDVTYTNDWIEDTIAIAKTQLGYNESNDNYVVLENGDTKGYTRYGDWYGNKYGDWCAMFVSFCLNYAEVEDFPLEAGCQNWILKIKELEEKSKDEEGVVQYNAWQEANDEYIPERGNIIFFNWDTAEDADHVGIVVGTTTDDNGNVTITTIEGNASDTVKYKEYALDNSTIMGYGILPKQDFYCGMKGHVHDEECYDNANKLICEKEKHIHSEECKKVSELTKEEQAQVDEVIQLIDEMPSAEEIDAKLMEYEEANDLTGQDAYFEEVLEIVLAVHEKYEALTDIQKAAVTNADKLLELEYMWTVPEEAGTYATANGVSGYNLNANNIFPIEAILGGEAGYKDTNGTKGKYPARTREFLANANVILINLPTDSGGVNRIVNLGTYFWGSEYDKAKYNTVKGDFGMKFSDWYAVRVEKESATPEYPGYTIVQVRGNNEIGGMSNTTAKGFIVLIRKSYAEGKYLPTADRDAYGHLNMELLKKIENQSDFRTDPGYRPSTGWGASTKQGPFGYLTITPKSKYDSSGKRVGSAGARSDDMAVVDDIDFKLFDYSNYINKTTQSNSDSNTAGEIHSSYRALANYFYFRGGFVDAGRDYGLDVAKYTPNVNVAVQDGSGHSIYDQDGYTKNHARVEPKLWNGYPILDFTVDANGNAITPPSGWGTGEKLNARSLRFLFDENYAETYGWTDIHKVAPGAVTEYSPNNTILQFNENTHTYWYDSAKHAVDYDKDNSMFRVRKYTERNSITADWPFDISAGSGDFLPFNYSDGIVNATYHSGSAAGVNPVADSSFRMNDVNYWFGMSMEFSFIQGEDGTVTYTNASGQRKTDVMEFEFSGDDDVWVFVDGVRILDLGGTHGSVTGTINFQTGEVTQKLDWGTEAQHSFPTNLKKSFQLAGTTPKGGWDNDGTGTPSNRFADYSVHTLKFFYMERGTAVANCSIRFNLPNFDNPLVVGKTLDAYDETVNPEVLEYLRGNAEYSYRALISDENGNPTQNLFIKEGQKYTLLEDGLNVGTRTVGANGIFKLKHGQQAVFENLWGIAGSKNVSFVIEELMPESQTGHYNSVQYTLDADVGTVMGKEDDTLEDFVGYYSPVLTSTEARQIQYKNTVKTDTLSVLKITKKITEDSRFDKDQEFTIRVKLDDEYLKAGEKYSINGTEYEIGENGAIKLKADQTAEILVPVLAGTTYEVLEDTQSGWVVTYSGVVTDAEGNETNANLSDSEKDVFPMDGSVHVTVTNSTYVYRVPLPIHKKAVGNEENATFYFDVVQIDENGEEVTEQTGEWVDTQIEVTGENGSDDGLIVTYNSNVADGTYYYKLTERETDGWICDKTEYIVAIEIKNGTAKIKSITKEGTDYGAENSPEFINYKDTQIIVDKTVIGNFTEEDLSKEFSFTAVVTLDGERFIPDDGADYSVGIDGTISFTLKHAESITITGIPYGAKVEVTESKVPEFSTHYTLNDSSQKFTGNTAEVDTSQTIHFINSGGYKLPDTGGSGTLPYTLGGLLLIAAAILLYIHNAKSRKEDRPFC